MRPILVGARKVKCMRTTKIGPDLRLRIVQKPLCIQHRHLSPTIIPAMLIKDIFQNLFFHFFKLRI